MLSIAAPDSFRTLSACSIGSQARAPACGSRRGSPSHCSALKTVPVARQLPRLELPEEDGGALLSAAHLAAQALHLLVGPPALVLVTALVGDAGQPDRVPAPVSLSGGHVARHGLLARLPGLRPAGRAGLDLLDQLVRHVAVVRLAPVRRAGRAAAGPEPAPAAHGSRPPWLPSGAPSSP